MMPNPAINVSGWPTKQQAAEILACSTKTIEHLAHRKQIQQAWRYNPDTGVRVAVYHPADIERLRAERQPHAEPFVMPPEIAAKKKPQSLAVESAAPPVPPAAVTLMESMIAALRPPDGVRTSERIWLTVAEASNYAGLPQSLLRLALRDGRLPGKRTGAGWRIAREALESFSEF